VARIRHATPRDIKAVAGLGLEALEVNPIPNFVISKERVLEATTAVISDAGSYCAVVEDDDGTIVGAVSALVHDMMFYERRQASVLQFYCKKPGWGIKLLRDFGRWCEKRRVIKMVTFTLDGYTDKRVPILLERLGYQPDLPVYLRFMHV
jgi:hypothetical protein